MALFRVPKGIVILHDIYGQTAVDVHLPVMGTDLFWWLQSRQMIDEVPNEQARANMLKTFLLEDYSSSTLRAHFAAYRCYHYYQKMANQDRTFTTYGNEIAQLAQQVYRTSIAIEQAQQESEIKKPDQPKYLSDLNDSFIRAEIPWRPLKLLLVMDAAIERAKRNFLGQVDITEIPPEPIEHKEFLVNLASGDELNALVELTGKIMNNDNKVENFTFDSPVGQASKKVEYNENNVKVETVTSLDKFAAYVPLSSLGTSTGRTDWLTLARYGLLDIRTLRSGQRGRAPLVGMVSEHGKKLITALVASNAKP